uniref:Uncharacterized protein n=1 Tax=Arion vulgaris TaxID=1028688 RepID=A0A0B6ZYW4_9EUPU
MNRIMQKMSENKQDKFCVMVFGDAILSQVKYETCQTYKSGLTNKPTLILSHWVNDETTHDLDMGMQ